MKKALIINARQRYEGFAEGRLNQTIADRIKGALQERNYEVKETIIEKGYDIAEEQEKHMWADLIVTQTPVFWFGTPWIHKKYIDEVFTAALVQQTLVADDGRTRKDPEKQYGTGGRMTGKKHMLSLTWNAPKEAFGFPDQFLLEGKTEDDVFLPQSSIYKFCGAEILPSFSCYDVLKNPDVDNDIVRCGKHLETVIK